MNFHSDKWIIKRVQEHYEEAKTLINSNHIVGVFYQGSGNYGLDYEGSDVDTKCITTPTFKEIALNQKPLSTTYIRENDEHIDLKDIRLYVQTFRKQNLNFLEILFTPYFILPNKNFAAQWNRLVEKREDIAHYSPVRSVKSMMGIASEKYFAMEHHYPARMYWINKFGYDPKQLHHLLRIEEFLQRYIAGEPYENCLLTQQADDLKAIKFGCCYNLTGARKVASKSYNNIHQICDTFIEKHKNDLPNKKIDELLDDVAYEIMKISIKEDFNAT